MWEEEKEGRGHRLIGVSAPGVIIECGVISCRVIETDRESSGERIRDKQQTDNKKPHRKHHKHTIKCTNIHVNMN